MSSVNPAAASTGWNTIYSTSANGYSNPVLNGDYIGVTKQPYVNPFDPPPKVWDYCLGRFKIINGSTEFQETTLSSGNQMAMSQVVAVANQFFLILMGVQITDQNGQITAYDPETLKLTATSPVIKGLANSTLSAGQGLLFLIKEDGENAIQALNPDFSPKFTIQLSQALGYIPFLTFTSEMILCASAQGAIQTFNVEGQPISEELVDGFNMANPFLATIDDDHVLLGVYDDHNGNSYLQAWTLNPLKKMDAGYMIKGQYLTSAVNTPEGMLLSGSRVWSFGSFPEFQPNYFVYAFPENQWNATVTAGGPGGMITMDTDLKFWQHTPGQGEPISADNVVQVHKILAPKIAPEAAPWVQLATFDLNTLGSPLPFWAAYTDNNGHLFVYSPGSSTLNQLNIDSKTNQITVGAHHHFGEYSQVTSFYSCGTIYATVSNNGLTKNYRLDPTTLEATELKISGSLYSLDAHTLASKLQNGTIIIYDAATLKEISTFKSSPDQINNFTKIGNTLVVVHQDGKMVSYDLHGKQLANGQTSFINLLNPLLIQLDENHLLVAFDDQVLIESTFELWSVNPLKRVESYVMPQFDVLSMTQSPQGTFITGKNGIQFVGPYPNFSEFIYSKQVAVTPGWGIYTIALPNNQVAVIGNNITLYETEETLVEDETGVKEEKVASGWNLPSCKVQ